MFDIWYFRHRKVCLTAAIAIALLVFFLFWMSVFDYCTLDTKVESYTIALGNFLGNFFRHDQFHDKIVIIPIKEEIEEEPNSPGDKPWRQDYAELVKKLYQAGAKVIVLDMAFSSNSVSDADLCEAMLKARNQGTSVIFGVKRFKEGKPILAEKLSSAASGWGALTIGHKLGYSWLAPLVIKKAKEPEPVLGLVLLAFAAYQGGENAQVDCFDPKRKEIIVRLNPETQQEKKLGFFESDSISKSPTSSSVLEKGDLLANLAIDRTPLSTIRDKSRRFSYTFVRDHPDPQMLTQFKGKIVMVGIENEREFYGDRYGFEWHADALNTLLNGVLIQSIAPSGQLALIVILSIVGATIRIRMGRTSGRIRISLLSIILLIYLTGTIYLYVEFQLLLNIMYHAVALLLTYWIVGIMERHFFQ